MDFKHLIIETSDNIVLLTINRPRALNALNKELMQELASFFGKQLPSMEAVKGVIITGSGDKSFVAGADVTEFLNLSEKEGAEIAEFGHNVFCKIENSPVPVVAVINGFALGGGCELAMACHLRIAEQHAKFGQPEVNLGLIPGYGGTQRLVQYIGKTKAMELILTADMIGAEMAYSLGLVNKVVEKGEGVEEARKLIEKIAGKGPMAVALAIQAINTYFDADQNGYQKEIANFGKVIASMDSQEGIGAFLEKRKANFSGK